ncbi:SIMPL domain-containing protein [Flaviaesturariibacter flavus]|uniref:SIMPL domain-containing protein n=1 Tax=Flaviaesturariibacter flavus TaxID=2502780 RepID=A0A4R1B962_9BACT|nr:SIMPL domain-containing protein [Flaviaesturariibacter flavus]TCJ13223.1 SIMPL domain-containing protein [Flaviaesturariibacter flavus]
MRNLTAAIIGIAVVIAAALGAAAFRYKARGSETIVVTGLAERDFVSDLAVWNGSYSRKSLELPTAYAALKQDESTIRTFLRGRGVSDAEIVFSAAQINREFNNRTNDNGAVISQEFTGYNLTQTVTVQSNDVNKVERLSREATDIIQSGIEFNSAAPSYYYSKLADIKIDLLGKASADARNRAETIAKNSGSSLGAVRKATMGVFQITGKNSNEDYSYGGAFNTSDKNKTGSITIRMEFAID